MLTGASGAEPDAVVIRRGRVLVLNRMPVIHDGRTIGSVTTLRDRTQLAELEQEIGAFRGTTDLLRAQTHEFANQLHTISGPDPDRRLRRGGRLCGCADRGARRG